MCGSICRAARACRERWKQWAERCSSLKERSSNQPPAQPFQKPEREALLGRSLTATRAVSASEYFASLLSSGFVSFFAVQALQCARDHGWYHDYHDKHSNSTASQHRLSQLLELMQLLPLRLQPVMAPLGHFTIHQSTGSSSLGKKVEQLSSVANSLSTTAEKFQETVQLCTTSSQNLLAVHLVKASKFTEAVSLLELAGSKGSAQALYNLAILYELGRGVQRDLSMAGQLYQRASRLGHPQATYNLAVCYLDGSCMKQDIQKGIRLLRQAAGQGVPEAQHELGQAYLHGDGVPVNPSRAIELFRAAAAQKDVYAQHQLGLCYLEGVSVPQDTDKGLELLWRSAKSRNLAALHDLGLCFEKGLFGIDTDQAIAMRLFYCATAHGHKASQKSLARLQSEASNWSFTSLSKEPLVVEERSILPRDESHAVTSLPSIPAVDVQSTRSTLQTLQIAASFWEWLHGLCNLELLPAPSGKEDLPQQQTIACV